MLSSMLCGRLIETTLQSIRKGLSALALVAIACASSPAGAQVTADESFRLVRKEYAKKESCSAYSCEVVFSFIPAKRRFEVLNVSCSLIVHPNAALFATRLYVKDGAGTIVSVDGIVPIKIGTLTDGSSDYALNHAVFIPVGPSQRVVLNFQSETNWINHIYCSLGGHIVILK